MVGVSHGASREQVLVYVWHDTQGGTMAANHEGYICMYVCHTVNVACHIENIDPSAATTARERGACAPF